MPVTPRRTDPLARERHAVGAFQADRNKRELPKLRNSKGRGPSPLKRGTTVQQTGVGVGPETPWLGPWRTSLRRFKGDGLRPGEVGSFRSSLGRWQKGTLSPGRAGIQRWTHGISGSLKTKSGCFQPDFSTQPAWAAMMVFEAPSSVNKTKCRERFHRDQCQ